MTLVPGSVRRYLAALVPVVLFTAALFALHRVAGQFHLRDVMAEFRAIEGWQTAAAVLFTAGSYLALTGYERLALEYVGRRVRWRRYGLTAFIAYAIGHNVGITALSGGAVRYRMYSPQGLGAVEIARIVGFCTLTFALGMASLAGISFVVDAGAASELLHAPESLATTLGVAMLVAVAGYVLACTFAKAPVSWREWKLQLPGGNLALRQIAIASVDLVLASSTLYVLLPASADVSFLTFEGLYMVAITAGVLSAVPGGLGVFESIIVVLLPDVPAPQMLGALLGYRLVYYALPFVAAVVLLSTHELRRQRRRLTEAFSWTRRSLDFVVPQAMAMLAFGAGFILLLSGATPEVTARLATLGRFLPLSVLELSHLAGSAVGVALLILARGLLLRLDGAWHVTMWLLAAGIAASLLKGLDYEEALLLTAAMLPLWWTRKQFYRKASLLAEPLSPGWLASALVAVGASTWVGFIAYRKVPYANELWWQFALDAHAPRMLRASLLAVLVVGAFAVLRLMTPVRAASPRPSPADIERVLPVVRASPDTSANLALLGDKALLFSESGQSFLMYGVSRRSWIAMGDPVGAASEREDLVWHFRELADQAGAASVFYQVAPDHLSVYVDAGLALSKLGEEARVALETFSLEGSARAALRQSHRRAQRDGLAFRIVPQPDAGVLMPQLREISDEWLKSRATAEKGFSLGRYSEPYLRHFPMALVELSGRIVAFANVWASEARVELSVDLMRHTDAAPKSVMDFLFIELMLWGRAQGYRWFNLGMAPLAGLEQRRLAPTWHRIGRLVYRYGDNFYNFEGLRQYKEKFLPLWRPRYLAAPGGLALPRVLLDVTTLISGGVVETLHRDDERGREPWRPTA